MGLRGDQKHLDAIDSLRFLSPDCLASKSSDGRIIVWDLVNKCQAASWKAIPQFLCFFPPIFVCCSHYPLNGTSTERRKESSALS